MLMVIGFIPVHHFIFFVRMRTNFDLGFSKTNN